MVKFLSLLVCTAAFFVLFLQPVQAHQAGDWIVRAGSATVDPREDSDIGLGLDSDSQVGITASYLLRDHLGIELLVATPFTHDISIGGARLGDVDHLPPTVSVQYFFNAPASRFQVYAGLGVNYTLVLDESLSSGFRAAGFSNLDIDDSVGLAAQLGIDYQWDDHWLVNAAVRYIDIDVDVSVNAGGTQVKDNLKIDPYVYEISIGYKF